MRAPRIYYLCQEKASEKVDRAVRAAGGDPVRCETVSDVLPRLETAAAVLLLSGPETEDTQAGEALLGAGDRLRRVPVVVGAESLLAEPLRQMARHRCVRQVLACPQGCPDTTELRMLVARLLGAPLSGLAALLGPGVATHRVTVADSRDKGDYVHAAADLARAFEAPPRWVEAVETVVDELVTNAIFNAPTDQEGVARYAHLSRRQAVALEPDERAELCFGCDGTLFGVSVRDPFGSLDPEVVLQHLVPCLDVAQGSQQFPRQGGAGLGLCRVFTACRSTTFDIVAGQCTEVVGLVPIQAPMRRFKLSPRSLLFFGHEVNL